MKPCALALVILAPLWVFSQNDTPKTDAPAKEISAAGPDRYMILSDSNPPPLAIKVSQAMREGWEPTGGVETSASGATFYQSMVKRPRQRVTR